jgi:ABC-type oligopeptide transport system ATPase subunit
MSALLKTVNLERTFGAVTAATDINVELNSGEIVGVIGSNGAGKTTFINMVTGYIQPSGGDILVRGESIIGKSPPGGITGRCWPILPGGPAIPGANCSGQHADCLWLFRRPKAQLPESVAVS